MGYKHCTKCSPLCSECSSISQCTKCTNKSAPVRQTFLGTNTMDFLCEQGYSFTAIWIVLALLMSCVPSIVCFCLFLGPRRDIVTKVVSEGAHNQNYINVSDLMNQQRAGGFAREAHNPQGYVPLQNQQQPNINYQGQTAFPGQSYPNMPVLGQVPTQQQFAKTNNYSQPGF